MFFFSKLVHKRIDKFGFSCSSETAFFFFSLFKFCQTLFLSDPLFFFGFLKLCDPFFFSKSFFLSQALFFDFFLFFSKSQTFRLSFFGKFRYDRVEIFVIEKKRAA